MRPAFRLFTAALTVASSTLTTAAFGQQPRTETPGPWSVQAAGGFHLNAMGSLVSASLGYRPVPRFTVLISVERLYLPGEARERPGRGASTTFGVVEGRVNLFERSRVSPYALVQYGRGISSGKENALSPEYATDHRTMLLVGGGVNVPIGRRIAAFADVRGGFKLGPYDVIAPLLPIRGGLSWRF